MPWNLAACKEFPTVPSACCLRCLSNPFPFCSQPRAKSRKKGVMKPAITSHLLTSLLAAAALSWGCSTTQESTSSGAAAASGPGFHSKYRTDDGRTIEIGKCSQANGGWSFIDPHIEKCWIADGFLFSGYDTLYIVPTLSTAKIHDDEQKPHELAKNNLPVELRHNLQAKGLFPTVALTQSEVKEGGRILTLENTIIEYSKGGGGARFWAGLYGAGQPVLRVQGKMTDGDKTVFTFEARRSGVSGGSRLGGGYMKDEDIQIEDIRSMTLDLSDFMAAIAGKYQPH